MQSMDSVNPILIVNYTWFYSGLNRIISTFDMKCYFLHCSIPKYQSFSKSIRRNLLTSCFWQTMKNSRKYRNRRNHPRSIETNSIRIWLNSTSRGSMSMRKHPFVNFTWKGCVYLMNKSASTAIPLILLSMFTKKIRFLIPNISNRKPSSPSPNLIISHFTSIRKPFSKRIHHSLSILWNKWTRTLI